MKHTILWDLDGTLTDPMQGITRSVQYALRAFSIDEPDLTKLCPFIGPPLIESFREFYGFSESDAQKALLKYREYFSEKGIFDNEVYPGIPNLLERLCAKGYTLAVATCKPTVFAQRILNHFDLERFFTVTIGSELDGTRIHKNEVIACALEQLGTKPSAAWMVGDRRYDICGAKENGLSSVGVLYGYGSREELEEAGADRIAATEEDLTLLFEI